MGAEAAYFHSSPAFLGAAAAYVVVAATYVGEPIAFVGAVAAYEDGSAAYVNATAVYVGGVCRAGIRLTRQTKIGLGLSLVIDVIIYIIYNIHCHSLELHFLIS